MTTFREMRAGDRDAARALSEIAKGFDGKIIKVTAGEAHGLSRDIGREGKRRASRSTKCYGNGKRLGKLDGLWSDDAQPVILVRA